MKTTVEYKGKKIDLAPYFKGFPYYRFDVCEKNDTLYYLRRGKKSLLLAHPLAPTITPEEGKQVSKLDFSKFNKFSRFQYNEAIRKLIYTGDKKNKEQLNIWTLDLETGKRKRLTEEKYIYGKGFHPEETKVAFLARRQIHEDLENEKTVDFESTLKILDLRTEKIETIVTDSEKWKFTWGDILWGKHGENFVWLCKQEGDRNRTNVILYNRETNEKEILLEKNVKRSMISLLKEWLNSQTFLFISNEEGYKNLYKYNLAKREVTKLTDYEHDLKTAQFKEVNTQQAVVTILDHPIQDAVKIIDPHTGEELLSKKLEGSCQLLHTDGDRIFIERESLDIPFELKEVKIVDDEQIQSQLDTLVTYPEELLEKVVHGSYEPVKYETFDIDSETGETRKIHAFLLIPDDLPEAPQNQRAVITAFYGGRNRYSIRYQILLEAGFIVLSPAIRGSFGFGRKYYALIDKDLGGNEVFDLIYGARYLKQRFNLPNEEQIGLEGGSHGGYEAMRALTFPKEVNERQESFKWGFAISDYGISNLIDYYETCNIPDWVEQKAGDPETEKDKLMNRSPVTHAEKASGPLFLAHGENDNRVPVEQSEQMANAMEKAEKPYRFEKFIDQGHGWEGLEENLDYYNALFDFLSEVT